MFMSHKLENKKEMWLLRAWGAAESKGTKLHLSNEVTVWCQALERKRMPSIMPN